ncbi:hypothetical protein H310_08769 [Aphanomyces invadans]|uniref:FYVE-type domain-containing protein n=1 Tax=Aphanomyces invadans TaxID=157072 RepID=A0A024TZ63_9STRA|nr:hypothetical protein H310_08769 [Aphanomyces invadans]ETV98657.1 hypothetical protein H310_08769 [Aphanomyces invadans]|eukprot:XP_008872854.1 hypothetical protein H310_08769 [Aphanomyces invadans]
MTAATTLSTLFQSHREHEEEVSMRLMSPADDLLMKNVKFDRVSLQALGMDDVQLCDKSHYAPKAKDAGCACCNKKLLFYGKHHCRVCGDVVCGQCSMHRIKVKAQIKSIRTCNKCFMYNLQLFNRRLQDKADIVPPKPVRRRRASTETLPLPDSAATTTPTSSTSVPPLALPAKRDNAAAKAVSTTLVFVAASCILVGMFVALEVTIDTALFMCAVAMVMFLCLLQLLRSLVPAAPRMRCRLG